MVNIIVSLSLALPNISSITIMNYSNYVVVSVLLALPNISYLDYELFLDIVVSVSLALPNISSLKIMNFSKCCSFSLVSKDNISIRHHRHHLILLSRI